MRRYPDPKTHAYHDGNRYHCRNIECMPYDPELREIDYIPGGDERTYTPILICTECGTTYHGLRTYYEDVFQEMQRYAEQQKRIEEERARLAERDNAETIAEIRKQEAKQEQALHEEISTHEGDITIPNIMGEPQKRYTRHDEGDIILPNTLTIF